MSVRRFASTSLRSCRYSEGAHELVLPPARLAVIRIAARDRLAGRCGPYIRHHFCYRNGTDTNCQDNCIESLQLATLHDTDERLRAQLPELTEKCRRLRQERPLSAARRIPQNAMAREQPASARRTGSRPKSR